jgi:glutaredoxin
MFRSWVLCVAKAAPLVLLVAALPAHALYKVVGPDGKVTYTDRPPVGTTDKVTSISNSGNVITDVALPIELRQAAQRFPVTLYTTASCEPCDGGRALLRARGVPYAERTIVTPEDSEALVKLSGARDAPTLTIGVQALRGFSAELWNSYLDSAGYPRDSRLPANYQLPAATPLTEPREAAAPVARRQPAAEPQAPSAPAATTPGRGGIRF